MDLKNIGWEVVDWINLAQDRDQWRPLLNTVINPGLPYKAGNLSTDWATISFPRRPLLHGDIWFVFLFFVSTFNLAYLEVSTGQVPALNW